METTATTEAFVRRVRHKTTAAALLSAGCELIATVDGEDGWREFDIRVAPELREIANSIVGDGHGVLIDWGSFRDHLRDLSRQIREDAGGHDGRAE